MHPTETPIIECARRAPVIGLHVAGEGRLLRFDDMGFPLGCDRELVLGRDPGCDIRAPAIAGVSRKHAALRWQGAQLIVRDLGSTNGTTIDGRLVTGDELLQPSCYLVLGTFELIAVGPDLRVPLMAHSISSMIVEANRVFPSGRKAAARIGVPRETFRRMLKKRLRSTGSARSDERTR
ncbi:FHA domain-containing protein [Haliangium sp.]